MDDKNRMETVLLLEKGVCDLFLHGTVESSTPNVHQAFCTALNEALTMQESTYHHMASRGWYPAAQAEQSQISTVQQKFSAAQ